MRGVPFIDDLMNKIFKSSRSSIISDSIDRLNYFLTAGLFGFFVALSCCKQYLGTPIKCTAPYEYKQSWDSYVDSFCFTGHLYYTKGDVPIDLNERREKQFYYYQWVPFVLTLQAFLFYLPYWMWSAIQKHFPIDIDIVVMHSKELRHFEEEAERKEKLNRLTSYLVDTLKLTRAENQRSRFGKYYGQVRGSTMAILYLAVKTLFLVNIVGQFFALCAFIGSGYRVFGWKMARLYWNSGGDWASESKIFPRTAFCDVPAKTLGNTNIHSVSCVLPINALNEKIYLFLWFWFVIVGVCTAINLTYSLIFTSFLRRRHYIQCLLKSRSSSVDHFVRHTLKLDGVLILRWIETNAGAIVAREICELLYRKTPTANTRDSSVYAETTV